MGDYAMRRIFTVFVLLIVAAVVLLVARQRVWTASSLEGACKEKTKAYFVAKRAIPMDWTPFMHGTIGDEGMSSYGTWRVGEKHYLVMCSVRSGGPVTSIGYEISEAK
jgi:hypothetical protein